MALVLRFITSVADQSHSQTGKCLISFPHMEKMTWRVTLSGTSGIILLCLYRKVPRCHQASNPRTHTPSSTSFGSLLLHFLCSRCWCIHYLCMPTLHPLIEHNDHLHNGWCYIKPKFHPSQVVSQPLSLPQFGTPIKYGAHVPEGKLFSSPADMPELFLHQSISWCVPCILPHNCSVCGNP